MSREFGRYRLIRHLATGGMGEVWLAEAPGAAGFAKRLVIKTLRPELADDARLVDQLVVEGRLLEALDHPNIAQILDLGQVDGAFYLAIEMVSGFDLRALRRALPERDGRQAISEVATLAVVASAAAALHHAATRLGDDGRPLGIVHHDVTPSNLMVRRDGLVKLVDFGVARSALMAHLEQSTLRGKLPYMAPEQLGEGIVDGRVDLFALALCAFELLAGERAMDVAEASGLEAAWRGLARRFASLEALGISAPTRALLGRMVAHSPTDRPSSAGEVGAEVARLLLELGAASPEQALADELAPAFERLEAEDRGLDSTLLGMLSVEGREGADAKGTLSLPGFGFGTPTIGHGPNPPPAPEATSPPAPGANLPTAVAPEAAAAGRPRRVIQLRRRTFFGLALALLLAGGLGWWLGVGGRLAPPAPNDAGAADDVADAGSLAAAAATGGDADAPGEGDAAAPAALEPSAAASETTVARERGAAAVEVSAVVAADASTAPARPNDDATAEASEAAETAGADAAAAGARRPGGRLGGAERAGESDGRGAERAAPAPRRGEERNTLKFRVVPVDVEVSVDGKRVDDGPEPNGVYTLSLSVGRRRIEVKDRATGEVQRRDVDVRAGRPRTLEAFVFVRGLP